jgi:hypothetical protein
MLLAIGVWMFITGSAKESHASQRRMTGGARVPSLRRHDPDQVRRVAASAASQSLARDTPENGRKGRPLRERVNLQSSAAGHRSVDSAAIIASNEG